jgi:hypothetical protein
MRVLNIPLLAVFIVVFKPEIEASGQLGSKSSQLNLASLSKAQRQQLDSDTKDLYNELQDYITQLQSSFVTILQDKIENLKEYSKKNSQELFRFFDEQVEGNKDQAAGIVGFRVWVHEKRDYMIQKYYAVLRKIDPDFTYNSQLSFYERSFIQGVDDIVSESIVLVQALILDLSSDVKTQRLSFELKKAFFESELHAKMLYEEQLKKNEAQAGKIWWNNLKQTGSDFWDEFKVRAVKAISDEVFKQISNIGKKAIDNKKVANGKSENLDSALVNKIDNLSNQLKKEDVDNLQKNKLTDAAMVLLRKSIRSQDGVAQPTEDVEVKNDISLCLYEKSFLINRGRKVQQVLQKEFDINVPLRIAICCSGGGNRAMVGTLGLFMAAAKHNILQATTYIVGLSGSTWMIAPWAYLYSKGMLGGKDYMRSLEAIKNNLITTLDGQNMLDPLNKGVYTPPLLQGAAQEIFSKQLMNRFGYEQNISLVDTWGALVGNYALNLSKTPSKLEARWSEIAGTIINGDLPLPLCSAGFDARADVSDSASKDVGSEYDWLETGPFEAGSTVLGYVPIQYFGSPFSDGKLVRELVCPEYPMSFYLGVYGSAFSLSINDLVEKGLKNPTVNVAGVPVTVPVTTWVKSMAEKVGDQSTTSKRHSKIHAEIYNFSQDQNSSILKKRNIGLFDGGIAFNIPIPLVIDRKERAVDIIFLFDSNPGDFNSLKSADKYFARKGIKLPSFTQGLQKSDLVEGDFPMRVYNDPRNQKSYNKNQPTFIYFATKVDISKPPFTTLNFKYTADDIKELTWTVQDNFEYHLDDIKKIMTKVAQARGGTVTKDVSSSKVKSSTRSNNKIEDSFDIEGINGEIGKYFPDSKTAYLVDENDIQVEYINVVEYRQAVTPPSSPLERFATMPNPKYEPQDKKLAGGQFKVIILYGQKQK